MTMLCVGAVSRNTVIAACRVARETNTPMQIVASRNQCDPSGGYIGWNQQELKEVVDRDGCGLVHVARDHGAQGDDWDKLMLTDLEAGWRAFHLDPEYDAYAVLKWWLPVLTNYGCDVEVGGEGQTASANINGALKLLRWLRLEYLPMPKYMVAQTGTKVVEDRQVGEYSLTEARVIARELAAQGIGLKEHNVDYTRPGLWKEHKVAAGVNIAPEYGLIETRLLLNALREFRSDREAFLLEAYASHKWERWSLDDTSPRLKAELAGHYVFESPLVRGIKRTNLPNFNVGAQNLLASWMRAQVKELT